LISRTIFYITIKKKNVDFVFGLKISGKAKIEVNLFGHAFYSYMAERLWVKKVAIAES